MLFSKLLLPIVVLLTTFSPATMAQSPYPSKPLRWIVGYPAGGGSDFIARTIGQALSEQVKQPVLVDNRPGAGANIGADATAKSPADGYTMFNADNGVMVNNKFLYTKLSYNAERDLRPVSLLVRAPLLLVVPAQSSATNLQAWLDGAKASSGQWVYGSPGNGTPHHIAMEAFKQRTGLNLTHAPYRGAAPAVTDLVAGQIQAMLLDLATARSFIVSGRLRALAVASPSRLPTVPDVPTMTEAGLSGFEAVLFVGAVVPEKPLARSFSVSAASWPRRFIRRKSRAS